MPWATPSLKDVRKLTRDFVTAQLGAKTLLPNSGMRITADAQSLLAHLTLLYLDWLSKQMLPDTAEQEWLDRHANIWLKNVDGTKGRKVAGLASGSVLVTVSSTGIGGVIVPAGAVLVGDINYVSTQDITVGSVATPMPIQALTAGVIGNMEAGTTLAFDKPLDGINATVTVISLSGGTDAEGDEELRVRVLERIQQPPMGGDQTDYVAWAKSVGIVTRAWCAPLEMGIGTVTVRFMCDSLRSDNDGFPTPDDVTTVWTQLDEVRPVAVKDFFVVAPIKQEISFTINNLSTDDESTRAAIEASVRTMLSNRAAPGQTIYASWVSEAISSAIGEDHHTLTFADTAMQTPGHMAVLGSIVYGR